MKALPFILFISLISASSYSAQKKSLTYEVEPPKKEKQQKTMDLYQYDSLEAKNQERKWHNIGFWSLGPKLSLGTGFLADKKFFEQDDHKRWFIASDLTFRNRAWHRLMAGLILTQNSHLLVSASWQLTPSRKWARSFYGIGAAISLIADREFRSIVQNDRYFITASYGWEALLSKKSGLRAEFKAYLGLNYYGAHFMASYIWHL